MTDKIRAVMGLDNSLTSTGMATVIDGEIANVELIKTRTASGLAARFRRYDLIYQNIATQITKTQQKFGRILLGIEGYSFGSNQAGHHDVVECGGYLRLKIMALAGVVLMEVPPSCIKKFVTGMGNAKKGDMVRCAGIKWGRAFQSSDAADAVGLAMLLAAIVDPRRANGQCEVEQANNLRALLPAETLGG